MREGALPRCPLLDQLAVRLVARRHLDDELLPRELEALAEELGEVGWTVEVGWGRGMGTGGRVVGGVSRGRVMARSGEPSRASVS